MVKSKTASPNVPLCQPIGDIEEETPRRQCDRKFILISMRRRTTPGGQLPASQSAPSRGMQRSPRFFRDFNEACPVTSRTRQHMPHSASRSSLGPVGMTVGKQEDYLSLPCHSREFPHILDLCATSAATILHRGDWRRVRCESLVRGFRWYGSLLLRSRISGEKARLEKRNRHRTAGYRIARMNP